MTRLALLCGLGLVACSGAPEAPADAGPAPPPPVVLTRLEVVDATPEATRPVTLSAEQLQTALAVGLKRLGYVPAAGAPPKDAVRLRVDARITYGVSAATGLLASFADLPADAELRAQWRVEVKLKAADGGLGRHVYLEGAEAIPAAGPPDAKALLAVVEAAALPVLGGLAAQVDVTTLRIDALLGRLDDPSVTVRLAVVDRLGALRDAKAVPALAKRTGVEASREVLLRIVGALQEIGDDAAAQALIGLANPRDRELLRAVVEALSVVGGARVTDFFDILSAHDAPDVRAMVQQARARLKRKAAP